MTQDQLAQTTMRLAAIPSTVNDLPALRQAHDLILDVVKTQTNSRVTIELFEHNGKPSFLAYRGPKRPAKFDILLNAHLDVVPAKPELFKPFIKGSKLYGRGVLDMKGTATVMADVFSQVVNQVPYNLAFQVVTDEEVGGYDGTRLQIDAGVTSHFVVIGEYANERDTIYNAARGLCWVDITFKGKMAHGGHLWHGKNAVVKAAEFTQALLHHYPVPQEETWTTTASVASLTTSNETYNRVPDEATLKIDFRFTDEDPTFVNEDSVRALVAKFDPTAEVTKFVVFEPALKVDELNPYVQGLVRSLQDATGKKALFRSRPAGSDGRHFALIGNDVVELGVCGQNQHSDGEYLEIDSLGEYQAILRGFLTQPLAADAQHTQPAMAAMKQ